MERLKNLTHRQKNIALLMGALVFGIVVYYKALVPTIDLVITCGELEDKAQEISDVPATLMEINDELARLNSAIGNTSIEASEVQGALLEEISRYCEEHQLRVTSFPEAHRFANEELTISTNQVEINGPFIKTLQLIHQLEQEFTAARVASVAFRSQENRRTKTTQLYATLYLQNISNH